MRFLFTLCAMPIVLALSMTGPAHAGLFREDEPPDVQRKNIQAERKATLESIFTERPELKDKVEKAPGYATFSVINLNLLLLATARGTGVVIDNTKNEKIYMKVTSIGGGIGAGVKDLRALIIFNEHEALEQFVNSGWQVEAQADAALKSGEKGGEVGESASVSLPGEDEAAKTSMSKGMGEVTRADAAMEVYRITEAGISAQATISGVKFSKDDDLN